MENNLTSDIADFTDNFLKMVFKYSLDNLKSNINNFELNCPYINYYKKEPKIPSEILNAIKTIDSIVEKINTEKEFENSFQKNGEIDLLLKEKLTFTKDDGSLVDVSLDKWIYETGNYYLCTHPIIWKLNLYSNVILQGFSGFNIPDFNNKPANVELNELESYVKKYDLKSLSLVKTSYNDTLSMLENGALLTQNIFDLKHHEIGAGILSICVDPKLHDGDAAYFANHNYISFFKENHYSNTHFVHEYTHHLQYSTFGLELNENLLAQSQNWQLLSKTLKESIFHPYEIKDLSKKIALNLSNIEERNKILQLIDEHFDTNHYHQTLISLKTCDNNENFQNETEYFFNSKIQILLNIHDAYQLSKNNGYKGFEQELWSITNTQIILKNMDEYATNPYEVHARINENLTDVNLDQNKILYLYLLDSTKKNIQKLGYQFNQEIANKYREKLLTKKIENLRQLNSKTVNKPHKNSNY